MRANGLFGWVEHNNARSIALLLSFVVLMQPLAAITLFMPLLYADPAHLPWYHWGGYAARYVPAVTLTATALFAIQMWWHVKTVRKVVAFRFVDNADEPRLCGLVEPLAIAAGLPAPYVGVLDSAAMNAFACGITRKSSVIVFTRGIIDGLDDDELSSVIAHELVHIRNGDARLIAAANVFLRSMTLLDRFGGWKPRRYRHIASLLFVPVLFPIYLGVALLSQLCLRLGFASRLLIASAREFIADAEAVRLTQDPAAFVSALHRIQGNSALPGLPVEHDAMMIDGIALGRLATHPPIIDRIQAIVATTGQMALDARPRRDTRGFTGSRVHDVESAGVAAWNTTDLERVAAVGAAPRTSALRAFREVGNDRLILGLRWDLGVAMLATFLVTLAVHRGNIGGVLGQMGHVLDLPGTDLAFFQEKARACQIAEWKTLIGQKVPIDACNQMASEFATHAKAFGINVTQNGQMRTDAQMMMLSPKELNLGGFMISGHAGKPLADDTPRVDRPATDLMASYAMPVHEAWQRLSQGSIAPFLRARQCGILVHSHVNAIAGKSVTWSITSETIEQMRLTATLTADGPDTTGVTLAIADFEKTVQVSDGSKPTDPSFSVAKPPVLAPPLRPYFAEALNAMLEGRSFQTSRVIPPSALDPGAKMTAEVCDSHRSRLVRGERFSIHEDKW